MSNINVFVGAKMSKQSLNTNNVMEQPFNFGVGGGGGGGGGGVCYILLPNFIEKIKLIDLKYREKD